MPAPRSTPSGADVAIELLTWATGLGIVTFALFPLLIPGLVVLAVFTVPLLVVPVAIGLLAAVMALPWLVVRAIRRRRRRRRPVASPQLAS